MVVRVKIARETATSTAKIVIEAVMMTARKRKRPKRVAMITTTTVTTEIADKSGRAYSGPKKSTSRL